MGFTYNKTLQCSDRMSTSDTQSPIAKNNLERKLTTRTKELQEVRERCHTLESLESSAAVNLEKLQKVVREKEEAVSQVELERDMMEKDLAFYITEVNSLKRGLELEQQARLDTESKAEALLEEIRDQAKIAKGLQEELKQAEIDEQKEVIAQLEFDRQNLNIKIGRLKKELEQKKSECNQLTVKVSEMQKKLSKVNAEYRLSADGMQDQLRRKSEEFHASERENTEKLEKLVAENERKSYELERLEREKGYLEKELDDLRRAAGGEEHLKDKLQESEQKRQSLEDRLCELKKIEGIEERMAEQIHAKHKRITEMAEKVVTIEEELRKKDVALKKQERTFVQKELHLEEKIRTLEIKLINANKEKNDLEKQTKHHVDNKDKTSKRLAELESEKVMLETSLRLTERKVERLQNAAETVQNQEKAVKDCRRLEGEISDVKQEKMFLESKVSSLQEQLADTQKQLIERGSKVAELQDTISTSNEDYEQKISELKEKIHTTELSTSESHAAVNSLERKLAEMRKKISELEAELNDASRKAEQSIVKAECEKRQMETEITTLKASKSNAEELQTKLRNQSEQLFTVRQENRKMKTDMDSLADQKKRFESEVNALNSQLTEKKKRCENLDQKTRELECSLRRLETDKVELSRTVKDFEEKEEEWLKAKKVYETAVDEMEEQMGQTYQHYNSEKHDKEARLNENRILQNQVSSLQTKVDKFKKQLQDKTLLVQKLNQLLTDSDKNNADLDLNLKALQRKLDVFSSENHQLKEETSRLITETNVLKASNFTLSQNLEQAVDRFDNLNTDKLEVENQMETLRVNYEHEKFKLDSQLSQQGKLIDFLQAKAEVPAKKKKAILGTPSRGPKSKDGLPPTPNIKPMQWKDMQNMLEMERNKNSQLQLQINKLKSELHHAKTENLRVKGRSCTQCDQVQGPMSPASNAALSALVMSPSKQASVSLLTPRQECNLKKPAATPTPSRPSKERMHHKIPHRFVTGLNTRATKCAVCLGTVHFVKQAAKCQECHAVCHPKCASSLPATCGLPTQYMKHFTDVMAKKAASPARTLSSAELNSLELNGWMKLPRSGKGAVGGWEKKWISYEDCRLCIYKDGNETSPVDTFHLFPHDADVTICSAIMISELASTASTDLPYIMKIETKPRNSSLPGRSLYLMALSFPEKQKWVATLEALLSERNYDRESHVHLVGDTVLHLSGKKKLDVNCLLLLVDELLLIGAEEGLFAQTLRKKEDAPVRIGGFDSIYQMAELVQKGIVLFIAGKERNLYTVDMKTLKFRVEQGFIMQPVSILPKHVDKMVHCTVFDCGVYDGGAFICTGTPDKVYVLKYNYGLSSFCIRQELPTKEPCSCVEFGDGHVVIGTDRFYSIELDHYSMREFLDKSDSSLAFAAFGAATYDSYPLAVHQISEGPDEFLLCFHEFGVFVDCRGKRSRPDDLKWDGLPLGFAYQNPYLYVVHFNSLQVIDVSIALAHLRSRWATLDIPNPRYVGASLQGHTGYIASSHDEVTDIVSIKVKTLDESSLEESKENFSTYPSTSCKKSLYRSPSKRNNSTLRGGLNVHHRYMSNSIDSSVSTLDLSEDDSPPKRKKITGI